MVGRTPRNVAEYFGSQIHKERQKAKLSVLALAKVMRMSDAHLGRIEKGQRPPTAEIAQRLDEVFPHREGWFSDYYEASKQWTPAALKAWSEYENRAAHLWVWSPGVIHGLLQTSDYARSLLATSPSADDDIASARRDARMQRQRRVLFRDDPPRAWFVVDVLSLFREVGSPEIMAAQCAHLIEVAKLPNVTMTLMPAVAHPANESGFIISDDAAYAESAAVGGTYQDITVDTLTARFTVLQSESYRASETAAIIEGVGELWARGENPVTAAVKAVIASK
jgi:transcriptional regulator with XRE-family HTH domain